MEKIKLRKYNRYMLMIDLLPQDDGRYKVYAPKVFYVRSDDKLSYLDFEGGPIIDVGRPIPGSEKILKKIESSKDGYYLTIE